MAIIAEVTLNELKKGTGNYSVSAVIFDDTKLTDKQVVNDITSARVDTPEQKKALWDEIIKLYKAKVNAIKPIAAVEAEAKAYIEKEL